jgi:hypothetical protein
MHHASRVLWTLVVLGSFGVVELGCASSSDVDDSSGSSNSTGGGGSGGSGGNPTTSGGSGGVGGGLGGVGGQGNDGGIGGVGGTNCGESFSVATSELLPVDLIIAVDTSNSMAEGFPAGVGPSEIDEVNNNLNSAADIISVSMVDTHVIMIADNKVCIDTPLGTGNCPADEKLPGYRHVNHQVLSQDVYGSILDTYNDWSSSLRPNALKRVLVVTDDDDTLTSAQFISQLTALDATFADVTVDSIVAYEGPIDACLGGCGDAAHPCCPCWPVSPITWPLSAEAGANYLSATIDTGGVAGDLCTQSFGTFFVQLGNAVVADTPIACEYDIPDPPANETLDINKVNVEFWPSSGAASDILNVPNAGSCGISGWYYDNPSNPTKIVLCPSTCAAVQADDGGQVHVVFGCETQQAPN